MTTPQQTADGVADGRTASTNNQGTVAGEGFDLTSSYVEGKYGSCETTARPMSSTCAGGVTTPPWS